MNQVETLNNKVLENKICVMSNVDNIEPVTLLTYKDLMDNVKKEYTYEIYLNPTTLWSIENNLFEINLKKYNVFNKNIKDLKFDIISEKMGVHDIVSKNSIDVILSEAKYDIVENVNSVDNCRNFLLNQQFKCNENLLPNDCVIPLPCMKYNSMSLIIKNANEIHKILNLLKFKITVTCIDFYDEFIKKIHTCPIEQIVQNRQKLYNSYRILNGMWAMMYSEYVSDITRIQLNEQKKQKEQQEYNEFK